MLDCMASLMASGQERVCSVFGTHAHVAYALMLTAAHL